MKNKSFVCAALLLFTAGSIFGQNSNLGKVLVIYYSWSKDANTEKIAKQIQGLTGADIFKIETVKPLPDMPYNQFTQWAKEEQQKKNYPPVKPVTVDLSRYDCIFVGGPVWWGTTAAPLTSFLLQTDFKGKTLVPFGTYGGGAGSFLRDFSALAKNARVLQGQLFNNVAKDTRINEKISQWVKGLKL